MPAYFKYWQVDITIDKETKHVTIQYWYYKSR